MIKLKALIAWKGIDGDNDVPINLLPGDSRMDDTGQQNIKPKPNAVVWEIWNRTDDITFYEAQDFTIISTEVIEDETT